MASARDRVKQLLPNYSEERCMRTTIYTSPSDPDETDEFPGCHGAVSSGGALNIVDGNSEDIEETYEPGDWVSYHTSVD